MSDAISSGKKIHEIPQMPYAVKYNSKAT